MTTALLIGSVFGLTALLFVVAWRMRTPPLEIPPRPFPVVPPPTRSYWELTAIGYGGLGIAFLGAMLGLSWLRVIGVAIFGVTFPWRMWLRIRQGRQARAASQTGKESQEGPSGVA
jgi:hypothetical protein